MSGSHFPRLRPQSAETKYLKIEDKCGCRGGVLLLGPENSSEALKKSIKAIEKRKGTPLEPIMMIWTTKSLSSAEKRR